MKGVFGADNIRWRFDLSGGTMMDFGTYAMNCLRQIFKQEPTEVLEATPRMVPGSSEAEEAMSASYRMGDGGTGSLMVDLCASPEGSLLSMLWPSRLRQMGWPRCEVELEEQTLENSEGKLHTVKRHIVFWNHLIPTLYHRIDIEDKHTVYDGDKETKTWTESKQEKSYIWPSTKPQVGEEWWSTYRFQLEEFVNKVKGREGSGVWIDGEDSIKQMEAIDATYRKAGLKVRPTSDFEL